MKVLGKYRRVTRVIMRIETVSCLVFCEMDCMFLVISLILSVDSCDCLAMSRLASIFRYSRIAESCERLS
jgi:hypothetical protein